MKDKIKNKLKQPKAKRIIVVVLAIVIVALLAISFIPAKVFENTQKLIVRKDGIEIIYVTGEYETANSKTRQDVYYKKLGNTLKVITYRKTYNLSSNSTWTLNTSTKTIEVYRGDYFIQLNNYIKK